MGTWDDRSSEEGVSWKLYGCNYWILALSLLALNKGNRLQQVIFPQLAKMKAVRDTNIYDTQYITKVIVCFYYFIFVVALKSPTPTAQEN